MRLKLLLSLTFLFTGVFSFAQKIGTWETHFSYVSEIDTIVEAGNKIYVLTDGKLYGYYPEDDHLETYVKGDRGNSDILVVGYNEKNDALIIYRSNYEIDILYSNGSFVSIPYLKDATQNINKTIREIYCVDDFAYFSAVFGVLVLNVAKEEIKEVGLFNKDFHSTCIFEDYLYGATQDGVKRIKLTGNMQDFNNWEVFEVSSKSEQKDFKDANVFKIFQFRDQLCFHVLQEENGVEVKRIYSLDGESNQLSVIDGYAVMGLDYVSNDKIISSRWGQVIVFERDQNYYFRIPVNPNGLNQAVMPKKGTTDEFWAGIYGHSLSQIKRLEMSYEMIKDQIAPSGPWNNTPFYMTHDGDRLLVTGGGYAANRFDNPGYLSTYKNGKWSLFDKNEVDSKFGVNAKDYNSVITDPSDKTRVFVSSWGDGLYEFKDDAPKAIYTAANTGVLEDIYGGSTDRGLVRLGGMAFDKSGNLWVTNALVRSPIKILMKDGTWGEAYHSEIATTNPNQIEDDPKATTARGIMIDRYNRKWIYTQFKTPYLFILDDNGTPTSSADDKKKYVDSFVDQDNKTVNAEILYDVKEDLTGNVWVATNVGPFVIYGSSNILTRNLVLNKIKIPRNDGTNNVDILLEGTEIKALAIDGANRKWLGTPYGVYLISTNGQETIHHFNIDNSPMPSNNVISLSVDPDNGTVYIGTDKGLVSYVSDAITGKSDYSNVYAFPNPVRPEHEGVITITGLQADSNVKITDVKGNILKQGPSLGGQYVWDGRNPSGTKVDTGVYLVFGATADGKSGVVTKILVVN